MKGESAEVLTCSASPETESISKGRGKPRDAIIGVNFMIPILRILV